MDNSGEFSDSESGGSSDQSNSQFSNETYSEQTEEFKVTDR